MDLFTKFKETLKGTVARLRGPGDPTQDLLDAIDAADNWEGLEKQLIGLRTVSRRRQQEVFERLEPLAKKVEDLLEESKQAKIKVMKDNLLRQAEGYMEQLEAEDNPAEIHSATCRMLTNIIKQVQRAAAMQESTVTADAVDGIAARLEDIVEVYESASEAAADLEDVGALNTGAAPSASSISSRLSAIYDTGEEETPATETVSPEKRTSDLENRLYEA